jgi:Thiamine biosynthesis enzyme ThiH and related uncharacterized enzymes
MLFGHIESYEHRVDHLCRLREQQDKSGGFTCFIPLPFLTEHSRLKLPEDKVGPQRGLDQLRTVAVSRLMLDNIPHIKAYWIMAFRMLCAETEESTLPSTTTAGRCLMPKNSSICWAW